MSVHMQLVHRMWQFLGGGSVVCAVADSPNTYDAALACCHQYVSLWKELSFENERVDRNMFHLGLYSGAVTRTG